VHVTSIQSVFVVCGAMGIIGGLLSLFLFETKGKELPNTVEEMIELQKEN